jgi:hypothetical protein
MESYCTMLRFAKSACQREFNNVDTGSGDASLTERQQLRDMICTFPPFQRDCLGDLGQYEMTELSLSSGFDLEADIHVTG